MKQRLNWFVGEAMSERAVMHRLGGLKVQLSAPKPPKEYVIDLSATVWADVAALLNLLTVVSTFRQKATRLIFQLGKGRQTTSAQRIFQKFLSTQGFLDLITDQGHLVLHTSDGTSIYDDQAAKLIMSYPQSPLLQNADCIRAQLIPNLAYQNRRADFRVKIDELIYEAQTRIAGSFFGGDAGLRALLLQKLRRLLHELLANAIEHAYRDDSIGYIGLYVRVHPARPTRTTDAPIWDEAFSRQRKVPAISQFEPNLSADWLELYICDAGVGLLHDLRAWHETATGRTMKTICRRAINSPAPLSVIAPFVYKSAISRHPRDTAERTNVTGLVHLDQVLGRDRDFSRIYTGGEFIGSHHPWSPRAAGSRARPPETDREKVCPGTTFMLALQPSQQLVTLDDNWITPNDKQRDLILDRLRDRGPFRLPPNHKLLTC